MVGDSTDDMWTPTFTSLNVQPSIYEDCAGNYYQLIKLDSNLNQLSICISKIPH